MVDCFCEGCMNDGELIYEDPVTKIGFPVCVKHYNIIYGIPEDD